MTTPRPVKRRTPRRNLIAAGRPLLVGVIASPDDLRFAGQMKEPPDLFELRLDRLEDVLDKVEKNRSMLKAPIIITARDPREGGIGNLSFAKRCELLDRFLDRAQYLDVELRSARAFQSLLERARQKNVRVILSFHDFEFTPSTRSLRAKASLAKDHGGDIFKVATRTDNPAHLARLVDFITSCSGSRAGRISVAVMGIGKLGAISRLLLARCGSVLNYGSLKEAQLEGQLPIDVLRSALRR